MLGDSRNAHLGRYELIARLATGGMGEIFLARLEGAAGFEKLYVVKRILPHLAGDGHFRTMLIDEARIASKLSHPSICQVYELGETDGELYIVMEYLEGVTLLPLLRYAARQGRPLELGMVACVISQVTEALHYAHELRDRDGTFLNIIHRDVTPSNIVITESGVAKVLDFGIAKAKNVSTETQTGTVKGKHAYMAPEQLRGQIIDRRVDVYAVGVLLYEMLALRRLFQRRTDYLTLQAVMEHPVPDIRTFRPDASSALSAALGRALHRDRSERYETVRQLGAAVGDAIAAQDRVWTPSQLGEQLGARVAGSRGKARSTRVWAWLSKPGSCARPRSLRRCTALSTDGRSASYAPSSASSSSCCTGGTRASGSCPGRGASGVRAIAAATAALRRRSSSEMRPVASGLLSPLAVS
ncbi:MAG TPA: serine/threonine-protein kinase, partial [Kofleriaceae bacterium]|nr:serine/threonine-protein kinase [Kofleriaceae bacterium]